MYLPVLHSESLDVYLQYVCRTEISMKIFIVGTGRIGTALAAQLSKDGYDITVIDKDPDVIDTISNSVDAIGYQGNGASMSTLEELGAQNSDILVAVTDSDELNLLSCFTAHAMGTKHTIARVRDVDYASNNHFYKEKMGLSMIINPDLASASEIFRILRFPLATRIEVFAGGRAELVQLVVPDDSALVGKSLIQINKDLGINLLICAIKRGETVFVPNGNAVIEKKDTIYLTGAPREFKNSFKKLNMSIKPLQSVLIYGNDRITYYLADLLTKEGVTVTIVDNDADICNNLADKLPKASVMQDDAFRYFDNMAESDIKNTDAFVAVSTNDENNIIAAMYAETKGLSKVVARISAKERTKVISQDSKICTLSREDVASDRILGYVRALINANTNDRVESLYRLLDGQLEFIEFNIRPDDKNINIPLKDLKLVPNVLIAGIIRRNAMIIPHGDDCIMAHDTAIIATINHQISGIEDIYE